MNMIKVSVLLAFLVMSQSLLVTSVQISYHVNDLKTSAPLKEYKYCGACNNLSGQVLNQLLNIVLNLGVVGGCGKICAALAEKTDQAIGTICTLLCDVEGVEEFVKIIEKADLDTLYFCELLKVCMVKDDGDAKVTSLTVVPSKVDYGADFEIDLMMKTTNGTGTGEIDLVILTVDGIPLGQNELLLPLQPGSYSSKWTVTAAPDPNCDPTQGFCEMWLPGNYTVQIAVCNGECGSKHPHSKIYDQAKTNFTLVKN